jgi:WD40-like Beta Propeller Repeat
MKHRVFARLSFALAPAFAVAVAGACGGSGQSSQFDGGQPDGFGPRGDGGVPHLTGDTGSEGGGSGEGGTMVYEPSGPVTDFPTPILAGTAPSNSGTLFGPMGSGAASGGPCIVEPESNVIYPQNWLRPRFTWVPAGGQNLFELRLHVANQKKDLLVYTSLSQWTMSQTMWDALRVHSPTEAMTLTVTGGVYSGTTLTGEAISTSYPLEIAPVEATGVIVYWTTSDGTALKGFEVGDENVTQVLIPSQVTETATTCIGCHTAAPGGEYVGFSLPYNPPAPATSGWTNALAIIDTATGAVGVPPSFLGAGGKAALVRPSGGISTFSLAHWASGDYRTILAFNDQTATTQTNVLQWIDLEATTLATATGTLARNGDPNSGGAPSWSHDGDTIAYVSTNKFCAGRLGAGCDGQTYNGTSDPGSTAQIYTIPYAGGAGGKATPLPGASSTSVQQYYPVYSPDDAWIAYDTIPNDLNMYDQPAAEVYVIPASGGTGTRLDANDPPACSGVTSPGVTNSWPKWGPTALQGNGSTYYWLVFSSTRSAGGVYGSGMAGNPQLYITSIVETGGKIATHGSLYLWNQPGDQNNHTPAWDTFKVTSIPPPPK